MSARSGKSRAAVPDNVSRKSASVHSGRHTVQSRKSDNSSRKSASDRDNSSRKSASDRDNSSRKSASDRDNDSRKSASDRDDSRKSASDRDNDSTKSASVRHNDSRKSASVRHDDSRKSAASTPPSGTNNVRSKSSLVQSAERDHVGRKSISQHSEAHEKEMKKSVVALYAAKQREAAHRKSVADAAAAGGEAGGKDGETAETAASARSKAIANERLWREMLIKEEIIKNQWREMWGFLVDTDSERDRVDNQVQQSAECSSVVGGGGASGVTSNQSYGRRLLSDTGRTISRLESEGMSRRQRASTDVTLIPND